jgi:tetratricopeptide (TPR) repeat protein
MTEIDYIERISELFPESQDDVSPEVLALSAEAVQSFPDSPELWCFRGHLIELAPEDYPSPVTEAGECYRKATQLDPDYADAWESLGYYLDDYEDDLEGADKAFRKAIEAGGDKDSYIGLARVLAQKGRKQAALAILAGPDCPYIDDDEIASMRDQIEKDMWNPE